MATIAATKSKSKRSQPQAVLLLRRWMKSEAGYDTQAWARAKRAIEKNRLSPRRAMLLEHCAAISRIRIQFQDGLVSFIDLHLVSRIQVFEKCLSPAPAGFVLMF